MNIVTLDIETKKTFDQISGENLGDLGVSFVGIHESATDKFGSFFEKDLSKLWPIIDAADLVVGFNIWGFDWPVLQAFYPKDIFKLPTLDLLDDIKKQLGHRLKLDSVAQATLGVGKSGDGLDAIRYFNQGDFKSLEKYCLQDVKVTRDVYNYGVEKGHIMYVDRTGVKREMPVPWGKGQQDMQKKVAQGSLF